MNRALISLAILVAGTASAADFVTAPPMPAASATAATDPCVRVEVTTKVVNGKPMELRRKVRSQDPNCAQVKPGVKLWD